jgi:hypothetical protein
MPCLEIKDKKYQTRKSPPYHAAECKGIIKQGKDGFYISSPDKRGIYKWVPANQEGKAKHLAKTQKVKGAKTYMIHNNYSVPFIVDVSAGKATVFKATYEDDKAFEKGSVLKEIAYKKIWIGDNMLGGKYYPKKGVYKGNSILMEIAGGKYVFVGHIMMEFSLQPGDKVVQYNSPVGNNDVPYPSIVGKDFIYFMWEAARDGPGYTPAAPFDKKKNATNQMMVDINVEVKPLKHKLLSRKEL